jgi:Tol biopolymer transport system component
VGQCCADPRVSPDGGRFSYLGFNGTIRHSFVHSRHKWEQRFTAVKQDWAPNGERIVFSQDGDNHIPGVSTNIATILPDGTHLRLLTHYKGGDVNAFVGSYSPNGHWIAFRLEDHGQFGLDEIHPDGSGLQAILPLSAFKPRFIDWGAKSSENVESAPDFHR